MNNSQGINPGQGYRLLTVGEPRQEGDEFKYYEEPWKPCSFRFVGWPVKEDHPPVRRRIQKPDDCS